MTDAEFKSELAHCVKGVDFWLEHEATRLWKSGSIDREAAKGVRECLYVAALNYAEYLKPRTTAGIKIANNLKCF